MNETVPKVNPEWKTLCPPLSAAEFMGLRDDIRLYGCRDPLLVDEKTGFLLDGHNRLQICQEEGIAFKVEMIDLGDTDPSVWITKNQLDRRNLNSVQKVKMLMPVIPQLMEENERHRREAIGRFRSGVETGANWQPSKKRVNDIISEMTGVSARQVARILKILNCGDEELIDQALREEVTIYQAYTKIRNAEKTQKEAPKDEAKAPEEEVKAPEEEAEAPEEEVKAPEVEAEAPEEGSEAFEEGVEASEEEEIEGLDEEEAEDPEEEEVEVPEEEESKDPEEEEAEDPEEEETEDPEEEETKDPKEEEPILKPRKDPLPPPPKRRPGDIVPGFGIGEFLPDDMKGYVCPPDSVYDLPGISVGGFTEEQEISMMDFGQIETRVNEVRDRFVMRMETFVNKMNPEFFKGENISKLEEIITCGYNQIMKMLSEKAKEGGGDE